MCFLEKRTTLTQVSVFSFHKDNTGTPREVCLRYFKNCTPRILVWTWKIFKVFTRTIEEAVVIHHSQKPYCLLSISSFHSKFLKDHWSVGIHESQNENFFTRFLPLLLSLKNSKIWFFDWSVHTEFSIRPWIKTTCFILTVFIFPSLLFSLISFLRLDVVKRWIRLSS